MKDDTRRKIFCKARQLGFSVKMSAAAFDLAARALCRMAQNGDSDIRKALEQEAPDIDAATDYAAEVLCRATLDCSEEVK